MKLSLQYKKKGGTQLGTMAIIALILLKKMTLEIKACVPTARHA